MAQRRPIPGDLKHKERELRKMQAKYNVMIKKAFDVDSAAAEHIKTQVDEFEKLAKEANANLRQVKYNFEKVKHERKKEFDPLLHYVQANVPRIFQYITGDQQADAKLLLSDEIEGYLSPIQLLSKTKHHPLSVEELDKCVLAAIALILSIVEKKEWFPLFVDLSTMNLSIQHARRAIEYISDLVKSKIGRQVILLTAEPAHCIDDNYDIITENEVVSMQ